jgi:hypothetical protein
MLEIFWIITKNVSDDELISGSSDFGFRPQPGNKWKRAYGWFFRHALRKFVLSILFLVILK